MAAGAGKLWTMATSRPGSIDAAIEGTRRGRFVQELLSNSAIFPIANIVLELFLEGGARYFLEPDFYAIVLAALAQAAWLSRDAQDGPARRVLGNLVGPAVYSAIELAVEGLRFLQAPHHIAYWGFSLAIGLMQAARGSRTGRIAGALLVAESVVRSMILFAMYAIFEQLTAPPAAAGKPFFQDPSHVFIAWSIALLGVLSGVAVLTSQRYLALLRDLSRRFRLYSEWSFGRSLLEEAVTDPRRLALTRRHRAILFMDVRGFTAWSEAQTPESVVAVLNGYCAAAEGVFAHCPPIRFKFAADEVMAIFAQPGEALAAARGLAREAGASLQPYGLGAGIGLHWGAVVEGLMGGAGTKQFDVIGDTVNTAKRIEGAAGRGEILLSEDFRAAAGLAGGESRSVEVKGKATPLVVHPALLDSDQAVSGPGAVP
jgi:adenylate cyclase